MYKISKNQVKYVRSLARKKVRDAEGVFVAEGEKCVSELSKYFELVLRADATNATALELEQMSSMKSPQGVLAVFRRPAKELPDLAALAAEELVLVLDGVQDPGNLGTIIRTADWFGVKHIVCSPDTADCWNPKVVQATMGAIARVKVHYGDLISLISPIGRIGRTSSPFRGTPTTPGGEFIPIYGTVLNGRNLYEAGASAAVPEKRHGIIVMGNEGNGISAEVRELITHPLLIPPYPIGAETSESLNVSVATAVVLAEFRRPGRAV